MKEAYRKHKSLLVDPAMPGSGAVEIVFLLRVRGALSRAVESRVAIDKALVALLKELHHQLSEKP
jgi:hypothetical protein